MAAHNLLPWGHLLQWWGRLLQHHCYPLLSRRFTFWQLRPSRWWWEGKGETSQRCIKTRRKRSTSLQVVGLSKEKTTCMLPFKKVLNSASLGTFRARDPGNFQSIALLLPEISNYTGLLVILKVLLN